MKPTDYPKWEFQPRLLTEKEAENPAMVLDDFFRFGNIPQIRKMMALWIEATVTGGYNKHLKLYERSDIYYFIQRVEKLIEAVNVLHNKAN